MAVIATIIGNTLDVHVDFTPDSLRKIDAALNGVYPLGHEPMLSTIMSYGIYLGEVFVRNVDGAEWQQETENFMDWNFKICRENHTFIGYPMKRVQSYWFDRTNTLYSYS